MSSLSSSIEKGESLKDTGITLRSLGAECIILRHPNSGAPYVLARYTGLPVLNAGDGSHEHPSQALLDLRTILAHLPASARAANKRNHLIHERTLQGVTVTIVGDILHSRVARSNALLLPRLGARVIFCGPESLLPEYAAGIGPGVEIERNFDRALHQSNVVMMLRIQKERLAGLEIDLDDYIEQYQLHNSVCRVSSGDCSSSGSGDSWTGNHQRNYGWAKLRDRGTGVSRLDHSHGVAGARTGCTSQKK